MDGQSGWVRRIEARSDGTEADPMADRTGQSGPKPEAPREQAATSPGTITAADVGAYLIRHPDFLLEQPELVMLLTPPAYRHGDNVVDMQHFMLQRARDEVAKLNAQQKALIATSRSNLTSQQRIHAAALAVIGATGFEQLLQVVTIDLAVLLDVDVMTLCVEADGKLRPPMAGIQLLPAGTVDRLLGSGRDAMLEDHVRGDPGIFGGGAGLVKSEALLRVAIPNAPPGLLALGSRRPTKFKPGHGTELLSFLARVVAITISQWLDL
jgi:uncharacterized protein YigA (DUF484 family)